MNKTGYNGAMMIPTLPIVDLHRHLDGNIRTQTIWDLAQQHSIVLPAKAPEDLIPYTQASAQESDLLAFLQKLDMGVSVLADLDACYRVAYENMQDARDNLLDYVELRFSPLYMAQAFNLDIADVVGAVVSGVRQGSQDYGIQANLIGILSRTNGVEACRRELAGLLAHKEAICALDLAGDELAYPALLFAREFAEAREAGWQVTVHAGEADGPDSIWNAIEVLGAKRIGHGVAAQHDPRLMDYMAEHGIAIESCPTSNFQTATVTDLSRHPMKRFLENGILVTLNTDDPGVSAITLAHEYEVAFNQVGLSRAQLARVQRNGVEAAFITANERQALLDKAASRQA